MRQGCSAWRAAIALAFLGISSGVRAEETSIATSDDSMTVRVYPVADLVVPLSQAATTAQADADFESLIDLIELRTGEDCWSGEGGRGAITALERGMSLVIRQSAAVHERIADLLKELRRTSELAVRFEVAFFEGALPGCNECNGPGQSVFGLVDAPGRQRLLDRVNACSDISKIAAPSVATFDGQLATITANLSERELRVELRSQVSDDHRYHRLEIATRVENAATHSECLVPDGFTSVREIVPQMMWMTVTPRIVTSQEPEEVHPQPQAATAGTYSGPRYVVPAEDLSMAEGISAIEFLLSREVPSVRLRLASGIESYAEEMNANPPATLREPREAFPALPPQAEDIPWIDDEPAATEPPVPVPQKVEGEGVDRRTSLLAPLLTGKPWMLLTYGLPAPPRTSRNVMQTLPVAGVTQAAYESDYREFSAPIPPPPSPEKVSPAELHIQVLNGAMGTGAGSSSETSAPFCAVPRSGTISSGLVARAHRFVRVPSGSIDPPASLPPMVAPTPLPKSTPRVPVGPGHDASQFRNPIYRTGARSPVGPIPGTFDWPRSAERLQQATGEVVQDDPRVHLDRAARALRDAGLMDQANALVQMRQSLDSDTDLEIEQLQREIDRLQEAQAILKERRGTGQATLVPPDNLNLTR